MQEQNSRVSSSVTFHSYIYFFVMLGQICISLADYRVLVLLFNSSTTQSKTTKQQKTLNDLGRAKKPKSNINNKRLLKWLTTSLFTWRVLWLLFLLSKKNTKQSDWRKYAPKHRKCLGAVILREGSPPPPIICHMSCVTCHMSNVTCHVFLFFFLCTKWSN